MPMSLVDKVRSSRDGDQFHYLWAARRCLRLLSPQNGPVAITVEGPSLDEGADTTEAGDHVIDVGEYYGSEDARSATQVRYLQLKHSTQRRTTAWQPSELKPTLTAFAERFGKLAKGIDRAKFTFEFVSNRAIPDGIRETVAQLARGEAPVDAVLGAKLLGYTKLPEPEARAFYRQVRLTSDEPDFIAQRKLLDEEARIFLNEADFQAPTLLKDFVSWKATSAEATNRSIRREDVLLKWGVAEEDLFPAASLIERPAKPVSRDQYRALAKEVGASSEIVLIHAPAGVGKSVLSIALGDLMPKGSVTITYDCYGGGDYRQRGKSRHRPADALIQVANELASMGLCFPLIPVGHPQTKALLRSFLDRLAQAATAVRSRSPSALLCLVFDAVDNAELAAGEFQDGRSFAFDLLRETVPEGVRIVMLCRPERRHLLSPPSQVAQFPLAPFSLEETQAHLVSKFPSATLSDASEFHRLSSHNPRVQANALALDLTLQDTLNSLGANPTSVDDTIARQLENALEQVKSEAGHDPVALERLCAAIAVLRPLIPIKFLSELSGLTPDAITSFATDFAGGRPLMVIGGEAIQFRDEPVEDWFRRKYRPTTAALRGFVAALRPHAENSAYVAGNLPGLLLEADQFEELVAMALGDKDLPATKGAQKREIEVQRLTFALRAAIRLKRWPEAAKLALRAGHENAGEKRELQLLQDQYDLSSRFFDPTLLQDAVAKRRVSTRWTGVRYAYEAAILSGVSSLKVDARSRIRMSWNSLRALFRMPQSERSDHELKIDDITALMFAEFNVRGAGPAAASIMSWTPPVVRLELSQAISRRFVDHGRWTDLDAFLAVGSEKKWGPVLAAGIEELSRIGRSPSIKFARAAWDAGFGRRAIPLNNNAFGFDKGVSTVMAIAEAAVAHRLVGDEEISQRLRRRFPGKPDRSIGSRFSEARGDWLRFYCLRAALEAKTVTLLDVAPEHLRKSLKSPQAYSSDAGDVREFKRIVGALLPWWRLRAEQIVAKARGTPLDLARSIESARDASSKSKDYYEEPGYDVDDQIATIWLDILVRDGAADLLSDFKSWVAAKGRPLFAATLVRLARLSARSLGFESFAYDCAKEAAGIYAKEHTETAESRLSANIDICRALLALDENEARAYFEEASEIAVHVGDEAYSRWSSLNALAKAAEGAAAPSVAKQELAVRFARCAEFAQDHLDKHFSWSEAMDSIVAVSPAMAVSVLARWLDRDVGHFDRQAPGLIEALLRRGEIKGSLAAAFLGLKGEWEYPVIVAAADRDSAVGDRPRLVEQLLHYLQLSGLSAQEWADLGGHLKDNEHFQKSVVTEQAKAHKLAMRATSGSRFKPSRAKSRTKPWDAIFLDLDVSDPEGLAEAHRRSRADPGPRDTAVFWGQAISRTQVGKEGALIKAMAQMDLGAFDLREILAAIPDAWLSRKAPKTALGALVETSVRKDWRYISRGHRWDILPLKSILRVTDLTRDDVFTAAIEGAADEGDFGGPEQIFGLVDLMAARLSATAASESLSYGASLMEISIPDEYGEQWGPDRSLPDDVEAALAGLLWIALGSPKSGRRWEAAHVARALLALPATRCAKRLAEFEAGASPSQFHAADLPFYELHARQWWFYAVEGAARLTPSTIGDQAVRLRQVAVRTNPHLIIRKLAARALVWLSQNDVISLTLAEQSDLAAINQSRHRPVVSESGADAYGPGPENTRFYIPYEFTKSELVGLANCFTATKANISEDVERVILDEWGFTFDGSWAGEPRRHHSGFRDGRRMRSSEDAIHGLSDYLVIHATITVGGRWLETRAPRQSPHYDEGSVESWSERYLPTRDDGRWISDLREPAPPSKLVMPPDPNWRWSVTKRELFGLVKGAEISLWGNYTDRDSSSSQDVSIRSALIKKGSPMALLAAAQTGAESWDCPLPYAGDDGEVNSAGAQLEGWVSGRHGDQRVDGTDPWAAEMPYPPDLPTEAVLKRLGLVSSDGFRTLQDSQGRTIFRTRTWSTPSGYRGEENGPRGHLLVASPRQLRRQLKRLRADLLICVSVSRERRRYDGQREIGEGEIDYPHPYFLHVLVTRDGRFSTL